MHAASGRPFRQRGPRVVGLALIALIVSMTGVALAATIGSKSAEGDFAIALASGTAEHPRKIEVKVTSRPAQSVSGEWTMVCSRGMGAGSKSGHFSGSGTFRRKLRMPTRRPDECTVSASGQLSRGGKIRVTLLAK